MKPERGTHARSLRDSLEKKTRRRVVELQAILSIIKCSMEFHERSISLHFSRQLQREARARACILSGACISATPSLHLFVEQKNIQL